MILFNVFFLYENLGFNGYELLADGITQCAVQIADLYVAACFA